MNGRILCVAMIFVLNIFSYAQDDKITDQEIRKAIETRLKLSEEVSAKEIQISARDGVVLLDGKVGQLLSKEKAEEIAGNVRGVERVINDMDVAPANRSDAEIRKDILSSFTIDPLLDKNRDKYDLEVQVNNGIVLLDGKVASWHEKKLIGQVAKGIAGVREVKNNIAFAYSNGRDDSEIREEIIEGLNWDSNVDNSLIRVAVESGEVTLSGKVGSIAEKQHAIENAWVPGVAIVDVSDLDVDTEEKRSRLRDGKYVSQTDQDIKSRVKTKFDGHPRLKKEKIDVEVNEGYVNLTGEVKNLHNKLIAQEIAETTVGVWDVENDLQIEGEQDHDKITGQVRQVLRWDPYVENNEINIELQEDGDLLLTGVVDSKFERRRAESVAGSVRGVRNIRNYLTVDQFDYVDEYQKIEESSGKQEPSRNDQEIREDLAYLLYWSPIVNDDIEFEVEQGKVRLTGVAESWQEIHAAVVLANEAGAAEVVNDIQLKHSPSLTPR